MKQTLFFSFFLATHAWSQVSSGSLAGEVRQQGSSDAIPGLVVVARQESTGFVRRATSDAAGYYRIEDLIPGKYTLLTEKSGYRDLAVSGITVEVNQRVELDLAVIPGEQRDSVQVSAQTSPVQTEESSIGYRLDWSTFAELPLAQHNVTSLITLGPGAIPRQLGGFVHDLDNDVQAGTRGSVAYNPPVNGARPYMNVQLLDGAYNTDRNTFAIVIVPPLESVQEFRIQSSLAPSAFAQAGGGVVDVVTKSGSKVFHGSAFEFLQNELTDAQPYFDSPVLPKSLFRQNQFGASAGGPLPLKNTFFYIAYEGLRYKAGNPSAQVVPDQSTRTGDFTGGNLIFDPASAGDASARTPFAGNVIPPSRINPISQRYLQLFEPLPNVPITPTEDYIDTTPSTNRNNTTSGRLDHQFETKGLLFARYTINNEVGGLGGAFPLRPTSEDVRAQQGTIGHVISGAAWLNEARFSISRLRSFDVPQSAFKQNVAAELGISGGPTDPASFGLPYFLIDNYGTVTDDPSLPQTQRDNTWTASEAFSWTYGRHTLRAGLEWLDFQLDYEQSQAPRGQYEFTGSFTGNGMDGTGDPLADFLLGFPQNTQRTVGVTLSHLRQHGIAAYLQDDWKVTSNLSLNLGLRYEYNSPYTDADGTLLNVAYSPNPPSLVPVSRSSQPIRTNFAPRVGLAYRLPGLFSRGGAMVFRAGYGIYFSPEIAAESYDLVLNGLRTEINQTDGGIAPVLTIQNGFPQTSGTGLPSYYGLDNSAATPYIQQWNGGFQKELPGATLFETSYVGSKGTHLGRFDRLNIPPQPEPGDLQSLRPFPELGTIFQRKHIANSSYNSLQLRAEKRFTHSLSFLASFVWSKSIDDADSILAGQYDGVGAQDENNLRLERGLSFSNVPRRFSAAFVYSLPKSTHLKAVLNGWQMSGVMTIQDGTPLNPFYFTLDFSNTGTPNRPNIVPGKSISLPSGQRTVAQWFNTAAFSAPAPYTYGDAGRDIIPGPGNEVIDLSLHRRFLISEKIGLELRGDAFNTFNHPNYGIPGPYPDFTSSFGAILSAGSPRRIQFGARFDF